MTKYRIVKYPEFYKLEMHGIFYGWTPLYNGTYEECMANLNLIKTRGKTPTVHEDEF